MIQNDVDIMSMSFCGWERKMFDTIIQCKCGTYNKVGSDTIVKKDIVCVETGESLSITYFECRECKNRNVVQVDNEKTNGLLTKLTKKVAKMSMFKKNHKQMSKKDTASISKIRTDLAEFRFDLKSKNQGMHYIDNEKSYCIDCVEIFDVKSKTSEKR